jgi:hypothetical protein
MTRKQFFQIFTKSTFFFLLFFSLKISYAEDNLTVLMQSMKTETAVKIAYQEIRTLELMDQPWHGSGYMYSMAPDVMIREQLLPHRVLMGVKGDQLLYFDVDDNVRHQSEMNDDNPYSLNIIIFKALMNADQQLLRDNYLIDLSYSAKRWVMKLKPKKLSNSGMNIVVSGLLNQHVDTISIKQEDGDSSDFILQPQPITDDIIKQINKRYQELRGE